MLNSLVVPTRRTSRASGLVAVWVGALIVSPGPAGLADVGAEAARNVGLLLLCLAAFVFVRNASPRGMLAGPTVLLAAGLVVIAWQHHWMTVAAVRELVGATISLGGVFLAMKEGERNLTRAVMRIFAVVFNRNFSLSLMDAVPERLKVVAVLCAVDIDLSRADIPRYGPLEIPISCWWGSVRLRLPEHWVVVAGRVAAARGIKLVGTLDSDEAFDDPTTERQMQTLEDLAKRRRTAIHVDQVGTSVVLHLVGIGGHVSIIR